MARRPKACFHGWLSPGKKKNTKLRHNGSAHIPGSPRQPKTPADGRTPVNLSRSLLYLVGQSANRTGWPPQYNWRLCTYIHQRPLPWHCWVWALPRPSCLCPSSNGRRNGDKNRHMEVFYNLLYSLVTVGEREGPPPIMFYCSSPAEVCPLRLLYVWK